MTHGQRETWWQDAESLRRLVTSLAGHDATPAGAAAIAAFFCLQDAPGPAAVLQQTDWQTPDWLAALQGELRADGGDLAFLTSGSSGAPKPVRQPWARLAEELDFQAGLQGPARRIVSLVPAHHIYGFMFSVLLPHRLDVPVADLRDRRPAAILAALQPGDLVIGFPQIWKALAQTAVQGGRPVAPAVRGITSTAPCPPETARAVRMAGFARLVELYGSSETMGIGWRDDPAQPFTLFPYWQLENDNTMLRHAARGFCIALPDRIAPTGNDDRHFAVLGRRDGAIQIGGINVHPDHIAAVLRGHPLIAAVAVRPYQAGATLRLKAFLVPADLGADLAALRREIETWLRQRLPAIERPRSLTFGSALPQGAMGKPADW